MEQVTSEMNGCVDFENLAQDVITFRTEVDTCGVPKGGQQIKSSIFNPQGILVIKSTDIDNPDVVNSIPFIHFATGTSNQVIKIKAIQGLIEDRPYNLTVIVFK